MFKKFMSNTFGKWRSILVDESELVDMLKILDKLDVGPICMGNCGWQKAPDCWYVDFQAFDETYYNILEEMVENEVHMLPETTGY